jgi:transposase
MILAWEQLQIFIKPGITDMRKQINSLAVLTQEELKLDPLSGNLFVFCNRSRKIIKILYWDRNGFCMWLKRLEKDKFPWPKNGQEALGITGDELKMILDGIDFFKAHKKLNYSEVF